MRRALNSAGVVGTAIVTTYGFWQLTEELYKATSPGLTIIAMSALLLIIIIPFFYHLIRPQVLRQFGLARFPTMRICMRFARVTEIAADFHARIRDEQRWLFLGNPKPHELVEVHSIAPELTLERFSYRSSDGIEVGRRYISNHRIAIQWRPKQTIVPFTEYTHVEEYVPPFSYDAPAFYTEYHCLFETGEFAALIKSPSSLEHAVAFRRPRLRKLGNDRCFMEYVLRANNIRYGSFDFSEDRKSASWTMTNPQPGYSYIAVFFRSGGVSDWQAILSRESTGARIRRRFFDCMPLVQHRQRASAATSVDKIPT